MLFACLRISPPQLAFDALLWLWLLRGLLPLAFRKAQVLEIIPRHQVPCDMDMLVDTSSHAASVARPLGAGALPVHPAAEVGLGKLPTYIVVEAASLLHTGQISAHDMLALAFELGGGSLSAPGIPPGSDEGQTLTIMV